MCGHRYARSGSRSGHRRIFVDVEPRPADHRAVHAGVQLRSRRACVERAGVEPARDACARRRAATSSRQRSRAASLCPGWTLLRRPRHPRVRARASEGCRRARLCRSIASRGMVRSVSATAPHAARRHLPLEGGWSARPPRRRARVPLTLEPWLSRYTSSVQPAVRPQCDRTAREDGRRSAEAAA